MFVIGKTLTNGIFLYPSQNVIHQTWIKNNHICKLTNAFNSMNFDQWNEPIE